MKKNGTVKPWTTEDIATLGIMRSEGKTIAEISEKLGRSKPAIWSFIKKLKNSGRQPDDIKEETPRCDKPALIKQKTLDDFKPREMIKHLYNLGYRIIDGDLYLVQQTLVNPKDIILNG